MAGHLSTIAREDRAQYVHQTIGHPNHPVPPAVAEALQSMHGERWASLIRQHETASRRRPSAEERRATAEFYRAIAKGVGAESTLARMLDARSQSNRRIRETESAESEKSTRRIPIDLRPPSPARSNSEFWWADWTVTRPNFYQANTGEDGIHFSGRYSYDDQDLLGFSFGVVSNYGIDWERLPESQLGSYQSRPFIDLLN
jgi:hypothetical protein